MPDVKTTTEPIEPVMVTVIGGTGDGGAPLKDGQIIVTPDHQPNVVTRVVGPIMAIFVRAANTFCISLSGLLVTGGVVENLLPVGDFAAKLQVSASLSIGIVVVGIIKDAATIFSGMEKKFPLSSGSV